MDLGETLDKIVKYDDILKNRKFEKEGTGNLPWSHRFVDKDGTYVEITGNRWMIYDINNDLLDVGSTPDELELCFKLIYG